MERPEGKAAAMERPEGKAAVGGDGMEVAKAAGTGTGNKTAAEEGMPKAAGTRRTKLVRVKQGYTDCLLKEPTPKVFDGVPEELINNLPDNLREKLRTTQAESRAYMKKLVDKDLDILNQYHTKGYAMAEIEIRDEEEEVVEAEI